jgi:lysophospholipase L1-like esterase
VVKHALPGLLVPWLLLFPAARLVAGEVFQFSDGDRVVLLGNTLIEREQRYGYWETLLTCRYPDKNITFRNLGWSGDTVFGHARAGFGTTADGFNHLKEHVLALKPTAILLGYGGNEAFEGPAGLAHFLQGLETLLDTLAPTKARIILLSPPPHERLPKPLPDPAEHNRNLRLYSDAMRKVAVRRGLRFVDLFDALDGDRHKVPFPLTDNGIHLSAFGYWWSAAILAQYLGLEPVRWQLDLDAHVKVDTAQGVRLSDGPGLCFQVTSAVLPPPPVPKESPPSRPAEAARVLRIRGLAPGTYRLQVDGRAIVTATAARWAAGMHLEPLAAEREQVESLRQAIIDKNRLYFHRWRPENETYLFGFRKYEQGQNAREIPQFDPLVASRETEIARLRVPVVHKYELVPDRKVDK